MKTKKVLAILLTLVISIGVLNGCTSEKSNKNKSVELINVSYDPTRELYESYNKVFQTHWKEKTGQDVSIIQSHGGSGKQARSVIEGNDADVVTLALAQDITEIQEAGLIDKGWIDKFDNNSAPYTSTIVFLVRKGNEKHIKDWDDLVKPGVKIITPNPKTSGGARWNFIAAWEYGQNKFNSDEVKTKDFVRDLYKNVIVLDSGARGATTTFVENGQGDVLIAWENEAYLSVKEHPEDFEIVTPSISVLAEPSVAVVDKLSKEKGTEEVAKEYLQYLYSDEAQKIAVENYYRPSNKDILNEYSNIFNLNIKLSTIDGLGGWANANKKFFVDGAIFDEIYKKNS